MVESRASVTKTEFTLHPRQVSAEEPVGEFPVSASAVANMAKGLRECITKGLFKQNKDTRTCEIPRRKVVFRQTDQSGNGNPIWFIGDLHGDLIALKTLTAFAEKENSREGNTLPVRLCFLGDFIDDAPFSAEVLAWIMMSAERHRPDYDVSAVVGNHDDGLFHICDPNVARFASSVSPSSFADELNANAKSEKGDVWRNFGLAAIDFFRDLPRMIIFDRTLMVAHGGVPHSDLIITVRADLESERASSDFVWNRLHESAQKKIPNRDSRGSQQGVKDFNAFISKLAGMPDVFATPAVFIRGHDHHEGNFKAYDAYTDCAVMTINAFTVNRDNYGAKYRDLAMLRWKPSVPNSISLFRFKFKEGALEQIWKALTASTPLPT